MATTKTGPKYVWIDPCGTCRGNGWADPARGAICPKCGGQGKNPMTCPSCGSKAPVYKTARMVQYRACRRCGHNFKTERKR